LKIHIVQKGDTLWEISHKYGVDFEQLKDINVHIASPDMIMPGMKIKIPMNNKHVQSKPVANEQIKLPPEKQADLETKKPLPNKSAHLEQPGLSSPLQMPKISDQQQMPATQKKEVPHKQKYTSKKQTVKKSKQIHANQPTVPFVQQPSYSMPVAPMVQPCVYQCPVCGQMSQQIMPYDQSFGMWPPSYSYDGYLHHQQMYPTNMTPQMNHHYNENK